MRMKQQQFSSDNALSTQSGTTAQAYQHYIGKLPLKSTFAQSNASLDPTPQKSLALQNIYTSQSPQPNQSVKGSKKGHLMIYGFNNSANNLNGNLRPIQAPGINSQNIKSSSLIQVEPTKKDQLSINKEKERINNLLSQYQVQNEQAAAKASTSSRNSMDDAQRKHTYTNPVSQPLRFHNSFQVQPANIHELNSFIQLNINPHERKDNSQLLTRIPAKLKKLQEEGIYGQPQVQKVNERRPTSKNINTNLKLLYDNMTQLEAEEISKKAKSSNSKQDQRQQFKSYQIPMTSIDNDPEAKKTFDLSNMKEQNFNRKVSQKGLNVETHEYTNFTETKDRDASFSEKKQSSKWILMSSKHIKNRSESRQSTTKPTHGANIMQQKPDQPEELKLKHRSIVEKYAVRTRMGFIPNMKKTNQDNYFAIKDFASVAGLHIFGVFDGHGLNGHLVSDFVKKSIPYLLNSLIHNGQCNEVYLNNMAQAQDKGKKKGGKSFLPPLVDSKVKSKNGSQFQSNQVVDYDQGSKATSETANTESNVYSWINNVPLRDSHIREAFKVTQEKLENSTKIDSMFSGTTAVMVVMQNNTLVCANSGDSRAVIFSTNHNGIFYCTPLSRDHKPEDHDEASRVRKSNGRIEQSRLMPGMPGYNHNTISASGQPQFFGPKRVWLKHKQVPGLAMTRSLGDLVAKSVGVTHEPELKYFSLTSKDKFVILASDGIWDRISNEEAAKMVGPYYHRKDADGAAQLLVKEAVDRWQREQGMIDDITIIVVFLNIMDNNVRSQTPIAAVGEARYTEQQANLNQ